MKTTSHMVMREREVKAANCGEIERETERVKFVFKRILYLPFSFFFLCYFIFKLFAYSASNFLIVTFGS